MATKTAIGIRREMAMDKLNRVMAEMFGEGFTLPTQGRDADLLHAVQLEYIADYLECQQQGMNTTVEIDLDNMPPGVTVSAGDTGLDIMKNLNVTGKPPSRGNKRK